jgi:Lrp/AsnC family transcriptional regulator, leucine-responsive regulatory protein
MNNKTKVIKLDEIDNRLMQELMKNGRATWSELAEKLGLSTPAIADRVRRLEERGIIRGYQAQIDAEAIGLSLTAFIAVTLQLPTQRVAFLSLIESLPAVLECHHIAGDDDYLLKVRCRTTRELDEIISNQIKSLPGIMRTRTTIALFTTKETTVLPLADKPAE